MNESMADRCVPTAIGEDLYYTVKQFAFLTNRSTATIYNLLGKGNAIRKLACIRIGEKPMIPVSELSGFPFVAPGPNGADNPYFFDEKGEKEERA